MSDLTYVFIDGNYLRKVHGDAMREFFGTEGELDLSPIRQQAGGASRFYIYDAIDEDLRDGENPQDRAARIAGLEKFFQGLRSLEGYHFRSGSVKRGKRREQKEVDVLLAVDMMTFGLTDRIKKAILISGDLDFRPAVEELVRHGVVVHVWYSRASCSEGLIEAADLGREMGLKDLWALNPRSFQKKHRIPGEYTTMPNVVRHGKLQRSGHVGGRPAELYSTARQNQSAHHSVWIATDEDATTVVWDTDLSLIERYVTREFGEIDWQMTGDEIVVRDALKGFES